MLQLLQKLIWARRHYGVPGTLEVCRRRAAELMSKLTRAGREAERREVEFDRRHGIDTKGVISLFDLRIESVNARSGLRYQTAPADFVRAVLRRLPIDCRDHVFIDLGSGKGRTLLLASELPFRRVIGVEFSPELHAIAEKNVANCVGLEQHCGKIECRCMDAADFEFPEEPLVIYLCNPFLGNVFQKVLKRLEESLARRPRPCHVIYVNPTLGSLLDGSRRFRQVLAEKFWSLYSGG